MATASSLGFGGIPNAIGFELMNRHDLGIHTEQIGASMAHMIQQGVVTNRYKNLDRGWSCWCIHHRRQLHL